MKRKSTETTSWLQTIALRVTRLHFFYIASYMATIVVFDSWNLITHEAVSNFWTAAGTMLIINTILWYVARIKFGSDTVYITLILLLILADIVFAALTVFWQRGLASKAVLLFAIPIISAATLRSKSTLLATATLSVAAYSIATVRYFNQHYGESFRIELYGDVGFYCALFFIMAALLWVVIQPKQ
jgi:hypothetical protein